MLLLRTSSCTLSSVRRAPSLGSSRQTFRRCGSPSSQPSEKSAVKKTTRRTVKDSAAPAAFARTALSVHVHACYLHGHQRVINPLLFHQLAVTSHFHDFPFVKAGDDICVPDGGESVGDYNGGSTQTHLQADSGG